MSASTTQPALALSGVSKRFNGSYVLRDVELQVAQGEIHGLLGANGSGKSTLIKILSGYFQPEGGAVASLDGNPLNLGSGGDAHELGLRVIHQDLGLVDDLSIVDNLALGEAYERDYWVSDRRERRAAKELLQRYRVTLDPGRSVGSLSAAEKTMVAIVRALRDLPEHSGVLILDEPTATLPEREAGRVFDIVQAVAARGGAVIYVTHRLDEVLRLAHRITVLRDGQVAATRTADGLEHDELVELIVGRAIDSIFPDVDAPKSNDVVLSVSGLATKRLLPSSLEVHRGEIVGVAGVGGSGVDELLPAIFGAQRRTSGVVEVRGTPIGASSPSASLGAGLAFAPADRARLSTIPSWTLAENLSISRLDEFTRRLWLSLRREQRLAVGWLRQLDVRPCDPAATLATLSGGNQQKAVLAKWLRCTPSVLMLQEPTAGVDVGARRGIYTAMTQAAADGAGLLISSTDVEEICGLCDRVLVMARGRIVAELSGERVDPHELTVEILRDRSTILCSAGADDDR